MEKHAGRAPAMGTTLGEHLAAIRKDRGLSLRQVEDLTGKQISNPYLNQIETGKILQPSPNILDTLANVYRADYGRLMELAGYVVSKHTEGTRHGRASTLAELNLTEGEERELLDYLEFIRLKETRREAR